MTVAVLTPSFWSADGRLWWRGSTEHGSPMPAPISRHTACRLRDFFEEFAVVGWRARDEDGWRLPAKLWIETVRALDAHDEWLRRAS